MFVYEKVAEQDKILYEKLSGWWYHENRSEWCVDLENSIYIVCQGKHGVETPVIFRMMFNRYLFEFIIPEPDIQYSDPQKAYVKLPADLASERLTIEEAIKRAFRETTGISDYGSVPRNIDDYTFDFEFMKVNE